MIYVCNIVVNVDIVLLIFIRLLVGMIW